MKYLADNNIIASSAKANGGKEYCVRKWFNNRTSRFVEFDLSRFSKPVDPLDEEVAALARDSVTQSDENGFVPANNTPFDDAGGQLPLPFT